jgi:hypothetical protein
MPEPRAIVTPSPGTNGTSNSAIDAAYKIGV